MRSCTANGLCQVEAEGGVREPELRDFEIKARDYALCTGTGNKRDRPSCLTGCFALVAVFAVIFSVTFAVTRDLGVAVICGFLGSVTPMPGWIVVFGVAGLVESAVVRFKRFRLLKGPVASRIKLYEEAWATYQTYQIAQQEEAERAQREDERARWEAERARREVERVRLEEERAREEARREVLRKRAEYWNGLSGLEFEKELGTLCERRGYEVSFTPVTGDEGADLILHKEGKKTVVQCKRHKSPAGPAVVRELYGTMFHFGADKAILACTEGFTKGARDFAHGKPIILVDALDLARMSEIIEGNAAD